MSDWTVISGDGDRRVLDARQEIYKFVISGDKRHLDRVIEMAERDASRAPLQLVSDRDGNPAGR
jgi:hypothetical protein